MREYHSCDVVIIHFECGTIVEDALSDDSTSTYCNRSQSDLVCDISDSVNSADCRVLVFIDDYRFTFDHDSSILKSERGNIWRSSKSHQTLIRSYRLTRLEVDVESTIIISGYTLVGRFKLDHYSMLSHILHQTVNDISVDETKNNAAHNKSDFDAKCRQDLGEFNTDVASTDNNHLFR